MDREEEIERLISEAEALRNTAGDDSVRLAEEATRLAALHGDPGLSYRAWTQLLDSATYGGQPEKALVAFAWCRAEYARRPDDYDLWQLLWRQKWILADLPNFPTISSERIEAAQQEMEAAFRRWGGGERAVLRVRILNAMEMGRLSEVERLLPEWLASTVDGLSDCDSCILNTEVEARIALGQYDKALRLAHPLITRWGGCVGSSISALARVLEPLYLGGDWDEVRRLQRRGYLRASKSRDHLDALGEQLQFLALISDLDAGLQLFECHVRWAIENKDPAAARAFWFGAAALFAAIARGKHRHLGLRLPKEAEPYRDDGRYSPERLREWTSAAAADLARRFDARNGNRYYSDGLDELLNAASA